MVQAPDSTDNAMLVGWRNISQHLDVSVSTARRWNLELGLPVADRGIAGTYRVFTSKSLIDKWIYARATVRRDAMLEARRARAVDKSAGNGLGITD